MSKCREVELGLACYTGVDGVPTNIYINNVYDANSAIIATYYTDTAGAVVDTSAGTVVAGECPVALPDVEWSQILCDVDPDTGEVIERYICRTITRFNPDGTVIDPVQVDTFLTDKVTPYTPTGEETECSDCPDFETLGLITDLSLLNQ